jgi:putative FmdB family regulatory protein
MPLYAYACQQHGEFESFRPIADRAQPAPCPTCSRAAARVISAPQVMTMTPARRVAAARNEKSRHEPAVAKAGCSHAHHAAPSRRAKPVDRNGKPALQTYRGPRPWVVEHQ